MPLTIEILSTKEELYPTLELACKSLNVVQTEFCYKIIPEELRAETIKFDQKEYTTKEAFDHLRTFRERDKGRHAYLMLVVDGFLEQDKGLGNLFGSHRGDQGIAVFTTIDSDRFVQDLVRFCGYYIVRYTISFLNPTIRSHEQQEDKYCIFHKKINKADIKESLQSGALCETCKRQLLPSISSREWEAIKSLLKVISNQFPFSLVMKGGGVKGLAFAGALKELEGQFLFNCFVGTSAGAIAATFLGAGYNATELIDIMKKKKFKDFKDSWFPKIIFNLLVHKGLYPGKHFKEWINQKLKDKIKRQGEIKMENLPHRTILFASRLYEGTVKFDSLDTGADDPAAFAVRCSMSIPYFFVPETYNGEKVYDGGLLNNFPLKSYLDVEPKQPFIGLYLVSRSKKSWFVFKELINVIIEGDERGTVDDNPDKIVIIDPFPIETTDFNLHDDDKQFLLLTGRIAALEYMNRFHPGVAVSQNNLDNLIQERNTLRPKVVKNVKRRRFWGRVKLVGVILALTGLIFFPKKLYHLIPSFQSTLIRNIRDEGKMEMITYTKKDPNYKWNVGQYFTVSEIRAAYPDFRVFLKTNFNDTIVDLDRVKVYVGERFGKLQCIRFCIPGSMRNNLSGFAFYLPKGYFDSHFGDRNLTRYDWDLFNKNYFFFRDTIADSCIFFQPK
jgi:predicted acylesterase/phospholipase RssA